MCQRHASDAPKQKMAVVEENSVAKEVVKHAWGRGALPLGFKWQAAGTIPPPPPPPRAGKHAPKPAFPCARRCLLKRCHTNVHGSLVKCATPRRDGDALERETKTHGKSTDCVGTGVDAGPLWEEGDL